MALKKRVFQICLHADWAFGHGGEPEQGALHVAGDDAAEEPAGKDRVCEAKGGVGLMGTCDPLECLRNDATRLYRTCT